VSFRAVLKNAFHYSKMPDKMPTMFTRTLKLPNQSFFLFGPRGVGKSSWLKDALPNACWYDLFRKSCPYGTRPFSCVTGCATAHEGLLLDKETWILHELRAWMSYARFGAEIFYWRTAGDVEVDFIWQRGNKAIAFEVKSGQDWRPAFSKSLKNLSAAKKITAAYGIYEGERERINGTVRFLPVKKFIKELWSGNIIS
jgi:predicted AAA+ superfamily ATPase